MKILIGIVAILFCSCMKNEDQKIVAQVGNRVLTQEELVGLIPVEYTQLVSHEMYLDIVRRWMDDEVFYVLGIEKKLHEREAFKQKMDQIKKKIIVDEVVSEILSNIPEPKDEDIKKYFKENSDKFKRPEPVYKARYIAASSVAEAWKVRQSITDQSRVPTSETPYIVVERKLSTDKNYTVVTTGFIPLKAFPKCLQGVVGGMKVSTTSVPTQCDDKAILVHLEDRQLDGVSKVFSEVEGEIRQTMKKEQLKKVLDKKLEETKSRLLINVNLTYIPPSK